MKFYQKATQLSTFHWNIQSLAFVWLPYINLLNLLEIQAQIERYYCIGYKANYQFIKEALLHRLNDDSEEIVSQIVTLETIYKDIEPGVLLETLTRILESDHSTNVKVPFHFEISYLVVESH